MTVSNFLCFPFALFTGLGDIQLSEHEDNVLNKSFSDFVGQAGFSQSYLAWRRRLLYCASAFLTIAVGLQVLSISFYGVYSQAEKDTYTTFGLVALVSQMISPVVTFLFMIVAAWFWADYLKSRSFLIPGWILGLLFSLWPSVVPLQYLLKDSSLLKNLIYGTLYAVGILPTYLSLIGGLTLGTKHVYNFAPSPLTGAMVVLSAAFATIIPFAALSLIIQVIGSALLIVGIILLAGPLLIVANGSKFTAVTSFSSQELIEESKRIILYATLIRFAGLIVIIVWFALFSYDGIVFFGRNVNGQYVQGLISYPNLFHSVIAFFGGMMFQAVLWTDIMVHVARNDNLRLKKLETDVTGESPFRFVN